MEHRRAHESELKEKRDNLLTVRGLRVVSYRLRLSGVCDVVEFSTDPHGITLQNQPGLWKPFPVEYKHGSTKEIDADRVQLCAQAMALEEMLVCGVPQGALFYETTRRREIVDMTMELRHKTLRLAEQMNQYFIRRYTPKVRPGKHCNACSLKEVCLPKLCQKVDSVGYVQSHIGEEVSTL